MCIYFFRVTNLFLNLAEDAGDQIKKYGLSFDYVPIPTGYLPNTIVTDNGSDFLSYEFERFLGEMNILHQTVPAATGSLKPNVERLWGKIRQSVNSIMENRGLVQRRKDSNGQETAILSISELSAVIYTCVIALNMRDVVDYPMRTDMLTYKDEFGNRLQPRPDKLWTYGLEHSLQPRTIRDKTTYYYSLMVRKNARIDRDGITIDGLPFWPQEDDDYLLDRMYTVQNKPNQKTMTVLTDPRSVNYAWFIDEQSHIHILTLNTRKTMAIDMLNKCWAEYEKYKELRKNVRAWSKHNNEEIDSALHGALNSYVDSIEASKPATNSKKRKTKESVEGEKLKERAKHPIHIQMTDIPPIPAPDQKDNTDQKDENYDFNKSFEEILDDIWNS